MMNSNTFGLQFYSNFFKETFNLQKLRLNTVLLGHFMNKISIRVHDGLEINRPDFVKYQYDPHDW